MSDGKIKTIEELSGILASLKAAGKRVVQCHGVFDLMHPGHLRHFAAAKRHGDILVVTVTPDRFVRKGPGRPVFPENVRAEAIAALAAVDYVAVTRTPEAPSVIDALRPDVFAKGRDLAAAAADPASLTYAEKVAVERHGGRMAFTDEPVVFSSSRLLAEHFNALSDDARAFLARFREAHTPEEALAALERIRGLRVLVVGDAIVDEYHYAQAVGMSSKEMMMSVRLEEEEPFAGGVLAAANTVAGFCDRVDLVTVLGAKDPREGFIRSRLRPNVTPTFLFREDAGTTAIRRYLGKVFLSKMFQVYFINDAPLPPDAEEAFRRHLRAVLPDYDLVMVLDYGWGLFSKETVALLTGTSRFLAVNTQTNSVNRGFNPITKYRGAQYFCIDEPEIRVATRDRETPGLSLLADLVGTMGAERAALTRGHRGSVTTDARDRRFHEVPVFSTAVVDRTGAGDAYFSLTAPLAAAGVPMDVVGFFGNIAGAIAVTIVCNREPVKREEVVAFAKTLLK